MIRFDLTLYSAGAIVEAVEDYKDIASIAMDVQESICSCRIEKTIYDPNMVEKEFGNYVLDKTVSKGCVK